MQGQVVEAQQGHREPYAGFGFPPSASGVTVGFEQRKDRAGSCLQGLLWLLSGAQGEVSGVRAESLRQHCWSEVLQEGSSFPHSWPPRTCFSNMASCLPGSNICFLMGKVAFSFSLSTFGSKPPLLLPAALLPQPVPVLPFSCLICGPLCTEVLVSAVPEPSLCLCCSLSSHSTFLAYLPLWIDCRCIP